MINSMKGVMKPVGVYVATGSSGGGSCVYLLKKRIWLRLFHILTMQDTNSFLLDPFGRPVSFNRVDVGDFFTGSLESSVMDGYRVSYGVDSARVRIEYKASLSMLCLCPWFYSKKTEADITTGEQYRIGRVKTKSTVEHGLKLISEQVA